ncbi:MAG TPA: coproporphyrinogen III oxidase, partial [Ruminococcaceae bacterium]|nr:coproporphyrinogen III oxidase [Oscillospiraceae bacterium]
MSDGAVGLYLHVPFCAGKCPYCDFYSLPGNGPAMDRYTACLVDRIRRAAERTGRRAATLYVGGGT